MDHPALAGHFPGNPIVPGSLILQRVIECLRERHAERETGEIASAKFVQPLKPGEAFTIHYRAQGGETRFECRHGETLFASGTLKPALAGETD